MKVNKKSIFAAAAVLLLAAALFVGAGAADGNTLPTPDAQGVITLTENLTLSGDACKVPEAATKVDLAGHTITGCLNFTSSATLTGPGSITTSNYTSVLVDGAGKEEGSVILTIDGVTISKTGVDSTAVAAKNGGKLIFESGSVSSVESAIMAFTSSTLEINGGTFTTTDNFVVGTNGSDGQGGNTVTINGGTFTSGITTSGYISCGIYLCNNDTLIVNGGSFTSNNGVGILVRSGNATITPNVTITVGGTGSGKVGDSSVQIPANKAIYVDTKANYPGGLPSIVANASSYEVESNGEAAIIASNGTYNYYGTLTAAITAAGSSGSIILTNAVTLTTNTTIPAGVTVTVPVGVELAANHLEVNKGKLIVKGTLDITSNNTLMVLGGATVDISGTFSVPEDPGCVQLGANAKLTLPTDTSIDDIADYITYADPKAEIIVPPTGAGNATVYTFTIAYTKPTDGSEKEAIQANTKVTVSGSTVVTLDVDSGYVIEVPSQVPLVEGGDAYGLGVSVNNTMQYTGKTLKLILDTDAKEADKETFQLTNGSATADYKIYKRSKETGIFDTVLQGRNGDDGKNVVLSKNMGTIVPETTDLKFTQSGGTLSVAGQYTGTLTFTVVVV